MEMGEYFLKPSSLQAKVKVELDLFNYATVVDTSSFAKAKWFSKLKV